MEENKLPQKESVAEALKKYKEATGENKVIGTSIPKPPPFNPADFEKAMSKETDPDLMTSYEIVKLPSKGLFYQHGISEVNVEYMTSKDEDLLTTPSLIDSGNLLNVLLRRKIKTAGIVPEDLILVTETQSCCSYVLQVMVQIIVFKYLTQEQVHHLKLLWIY
jgi:hypothetical protein